VAEKHVNKADLAQLMGVSSVTIGQWVSKGCPYVQKGALGKSWVFDVPEVVSWREEQVALQAVGDTKSLDIEEARRRKVAAEAALTELDLAKRKGELVEIEDVAQSVGEDYANLRAKLLSLPVKLAPQAAGISDAAELQDLAESLVHEALEELVSDGIYAGAAQGAGGTEADEPQAAA
jgi:phage terminase Nu1 subunit (DNA packaging protein)